MKLVSFLMPTRNPWKGLEAAIVSIRDSCSQPDDIEILLRIDDDDQERISLIPDLERIYKAKCIVGPRGSGYNNMGNFIAELVKVADSRWCWLFDDDAWVEGDWYDQLNEIDQDQKTGPAVNAENYVLGESWYKNSHNGGPVGLIVPTSFARTIPPNYPVDQVWLDAVLQNGWHIRQLIGVSYHHDGRIRA